MGKKNSNRNAPQQAGAVAVATPSPAARDRLVAMWSASFENASRVYQDRGKNLDLHVESAWLGSVVERFQTAGDVDLSRWVERFAEVCKELGKFKEGLVEEAGERWKEAQDLAKEALNREGLVQQRLAELEENSRSIEENQAELDAERRAVADKHAELLELQRGLNAREINAEAGFAEQNAQALQQLKNHQHQLKKQHEAEVEKIQLEKQRLAEQCSDAARKLAEIKLTCTEEESARVRRLDEREHELSQRKAELDRARSRLDREWADVGREKAEIEELLAEEMKEERSSHEQALARLERAQEKAWAKIDELREKLAGMQVLQRALGEQTPADILEQLDSLQQENTDLKRQLNQSGSAELQLECDYLRQSKADLERELAALRPELDDLRREMSTKRVAATELEAVAREKRTLELHKNTLDAHINDLESRIDHLTNAQKAQTPFPAMSQMDSARDYRASIQLEPVADLKQFAEELQHRIARAEHPVELFYPLEDIRILLGGLAMSQLHVLQGISGTGKTSLAKAFAKAMGGFCTDIAVQAGWRDRDDLLGHYNAFERRFYEKDCLQALYKAQTPRWKDTCNVILLDEMNLSRPEQYFAEFLSALEKNNQDERLISLAETEMPGAPAMLREGRKVLVPANVWFIGTANHDETTNDLADKTYDRAHVMTLPKQDRRFNIKHYDPAGFSYASLNKSFDYACNKHQQEVAELLVRLSKDPLSQQLEKDFELGWGNRFEKQAKRFIPVVKAAGGNNGEALDHLLSARIMRKGKVTGRYDLKVDAIRTLLSNLENFWLEAGLDDEPRKCLQLLEADIHRLEDMN